MSWSPDSLALVFGLIDPRTRADLWVLPLKGDRKPQPFLHSSFSEGSGQLSPDGKWLAYTSNETGQNEVYVRSFPSGPGRKLSTDGGNYPRWRPDGKEIFYLSDGKLMAAEVRNTGPSSSFEYVPPKELFDTHISSAIHAPYRPYAVSRDGQRFLVPRPVVPLADVSPTSVTVVINWPALLQDQR